MPNDEEKLAIKLAQDIGYIKGTVKGLDGKVDGLSRKVESLEGAMGGKISGIHQSIAGLVRREDCAQHMQAIQQDLGGALSAAAQAQAAAQAAAEKVDEAAETAEDAHEAAEKVRGEVTARFAIPKEDTKKPTPTLWERAVEHSKGLTSILVFLGMLGAGVVALAHFVGKVERTLSIAEESRKQEQAAIVKKLAEPPRLVYVRSSGADAGAGSAAWVVIEPSPRPVPKHAAPPDKKR